MTLKQKQPKQPLPLPSNINLSHPDFPYWTGLSDLLTQASFENIYSFAEIKDIYNLFNSLDESQKRQYLRKLQKFIDQTISNRELIFSMYDDEELKEEIQEYIKYFPPSMQEQVYKFVTLGREPYPTFFEDLTQAFEQQRQLQVLDDEETYFGQLQPEAIIDDLKFNPLRFGNQFERSTANNTKPLTQEELNNLLYSTQDIRQNLEQTPEYNFNPLVNKLEQNKSDIEMSATSRNLNLETLTRATGTIGRQSLTSKLLNNSRLIKSVEPNPTNSDELNQSAKTPTYLNQSKLQKLNSLKNSKPDNKNQL